MSDTGDGAKGADYVIVGAGSAGCVLAHRLSAGKDVSVLVLEAGGWDRNFLMRVPLASRKFWYHPKYNWSYESEPEPGLGNRPIIVPRGKIIGGSSSINGMIYARGHPADYDQWRQMGNDGWSYADLLPYFRRAESNPRGETRHHGGSGPLKVTVLAPNPIAHNGLRAAAQGAGLPVTDDVHGDLPEGIGPPEYTIGNGRRASAARMYLRPVLNRPNLAIETRVMVTRVLFEGGRAVGVEYRRDGQLKVARADREVILSGGAINSPQLLMLSGIGPAGHLREHGIEPVVDAPGVGRDLQDHLAVAVRNGCHPSIDVEPELRFDRLTLHMIRWFFTGKGLPAALPLAGIGFIRSRPELERPDIQYLFSGIPPEGDVWLPPFRRRVGATFMCRVIGLHPESRGALTLRSADPARKPRIIHNYLSREADVITLRDGIRKAREILTQPALKELVGPESEPGPGITSDADLDDYIRATANTIYHPTSTCRMGSDAEAVVDSDLRVRGVEGLRVVDASVMPTVPGGNTNAPTIAVAEKAADMILGRPPLPRAEIDPAGPDKAGTGI